MSYEIRRPFGPAPDAWPYHPGVPDARARRAVVGSLAFVAIMMAIFARRPAVLLGTVAVLWLGLSWFLGPS